MSVLRVAAVMILATAVAAIQARQAAPRSAKNGIYTTEQADRGKTLYGEKCVECHGTMASATPDMAPLLNDYVFQNTWKERSLAELFDRIRNTMPQSKPGSLAPQEVVDLIAYILSANQLPAGEAPLVQDVEVLKQLRLEAGQP